MLKITLEQWRMFKSVVEYGGFNQASAVVHKSQSSIHNAVNKIEQALGIKLFQIKGRKTLLTEAGELILRHANHLLNEAAKVETVGLNLAEGIETTLRVAVDEIFPQHLLYKVLDAVSAQFPFLRIELMESVLRGSSEMLENLEVDIAVSPFTVNGLFNEELCQIDFIAVANPSHPLNKSATPITLKDLKSHRQIVVRDTATNNKSDQGWLEADQRWTIGHMRTSIDMVRNGFGFAWLPVSLIENELKDGCLKPLNLKVGSIRKEYLHLLFGDEDQLGPAARSFLGEIRYQSLHLPVS